MNVERKGSRASIIATDETSIDHPKDHPKVVLLQNNGTNDNDENNEHINEYISESSFN